MSAYPRILLADITVNWPTASMPTRLPKGTMIDVVPGSALEAAIGAGNLAPAVVNRDYIGHGALGNLAQ